VASCEQTDDCREFYACHPIMSAQGTTVGYCWQACLSSSDCGNETCNTYGLCGNEHPPQQAPPPATTRESQKTGGCAAAGDSVLGALVCGLWLMRRKGWQARAA
jgi:hypothetical protein